MTQFTCKGVKQINNRISFKHLYHAYLSAFFISAGVPNGEFPEILMAKCRSRFYCTWFFCWGDIVRKINVSRAWDPVHAGDKALTRETPAKRGRVNRYAHCFLLLYLYCRPYHGVLLLVDGHHLLSSLSTDCTPALNRLINVIIQQPVRSLQIIALEADLSLSQVS